MKNTVFLKTLVLVVISVFVISCDKDYNSLGGDIAGGKPFDIKGELFDVIAYNQKIERVQTNNLPINQLGIATNYLGTTRANFVTQLSLATLNPVVKSNAVIDSVVLTVPYFSTKLRTEGEWSRYRLDSISGYSMSGELQNFNPMRLQIFRNGYYLESFNGSENKKFFSNEDNLFDNAKSDLLFDSSVFKPDQREQYVFETNQNDAKKIRLAPQMRLKLDSAKFQQLLSDANSSGQSYNFETNENFKKYFRGLYYKVDNGNPNSGALMSLDFTKGGITIYYKQDKVNNNSAEKEAASLTFSMTGSTVNTFVNSDVYDATPKPTAGGNDKLFLKGGQGCMALVDLFTNPTQLELFRGKKLLINEASLSFTIENHLDLPSPLRVYLYDADNNKPLFDYYADITVNSADIRLNKYVFGGIFERLDSNTKRYRIKITELVKDIYKNYSIDNKVKVRLGLVVTNNINNINLVSIKRAGDVDLSTIDYNGISKSLKYLPIASVAQASGVVLYGNLPATDSNYDKRIRLEVNYTETK